MKQKIEKLADWKPEHGIDCYIVVAVCNFDDVCMGCFARTKDGMREARMLARAVAGNPALRLQQKHQANDTTLLFARIWEVRNGNTICEVAEYEPEFEK